MLFSRFPRFYDGHPFLRGHFWEMQKEAFDYDIASSESETDSDPLCAVLAPRKTPESARTHELLLRYEIALDRQISRSLLRLQQLQDRRTSAPHMSNENESAEEEISAPCETNPATP